MTDKQPWKKNWTIIGQPPKGGAQGNTSFVASTSNEEIVGVLKTLKKQNDHKARCRMHREVTSLEILNAIKIKVPRALDSNHTLYENHDVPLYLVMERISGSTLTDFINASGQLSIDKAANFALDLASTIGAAHEMDVRHRDLKPDNIIVRDADSNDLVIVDYGLSFNLDGPDEIVTEPEEQFRNRFFTLGDTTTYSGDYRDPRIDLAALCAVFFYCLTGKVPGNVHDANGQMPHRRKGQSIREIWSNDQRARRIEVLLDRGFQSDVAARFQTADEFIEQLRKILAGEPVKKDPLSMAGESTSRLTARSPAARIAAAEEPCKRALSHIYHQAATLSSKVGPIYNVAGRQEYFQPGHLINGMSPVTSHSNSPMVIAPRFDITCVIRYCIVLRGTQCVLMQQFELIKGKAVGGFSISNNPPFETTDWEESYTFDFDKPPDLPELTKTSHNNVTNAIERIESHIE